MKLYVVLGLIVTALSVPVTMDYSDKKDYIDTVIAQQPVCNVIAMTSVLTPHLLDDVITGYVDNQVSGVELNIYDSLLYTFALKASITDNCTRR